MSQKLFDELDDPILWSDHKIEMDWLWRDAHGLMRAVHLHQHRNLLCFFYEEEWGDGEARPCPDCMHYITLNGKCVHCEKELDKATHF